MAETTPTQETINSQLEVHAYSTAGDEADAEQAAYLQFTVADYYHEPGARIDLSKYEHLRDTEPDGTQNVQAIMRTGDGREFALYQGAIYDVTATENTGKRVLVKLGLNDSRNFGEMEIGKELPFYRLKKDAELSEVIVNNGLLPLKDAEELVTGAGTIHKSNPFEEVKHAIDSRPTLKEAQAVERRAAAAAKRASKGPVTDFGVPIEEVKVVIPTSRYTNNHAVRNGRTIGIFGDRRKAEAELHTKTFVNAHGFDNSPQAPVEEVWDQNNRLAPYKDKYGNEIIHTTGKVKHKNKEGEWEEKELKDATRVDLVVKKDPNGTLMKEVDGEMTPHSYTIFGPGPEADSKSLQEINYKMRVLAETDLAGNPIYYVTDENGDAVEVDEPKTSEGRGEYVNLRAIRDKDGEVKRNPDGSLAGYHTGEEPAWEAGGLMFERKFAELDDNILRKRTRLGKLASRVMFKKDEVAEGLGFRPPATDETEHYRESVLNPPTAPEGMKVVKSYKVTEGDKIFTRYEKKK